MKILIVQLIIFLCLLTVVSSFFIEYAYSSSNEKNDTTIIYLLDPTKLNYVYGMISFPYLLNLVNASSNYSINNMQCGQMLPKLDSTGKATNIFGIYSFNCNNLVIFQKYPLPDNNISSTKRIGTFFSFQHDAIYKIVSFQYLLDSTNIFNIENLICGLIEYSDSNKKWDIFPIKCNTILMFFSSKLK